MNKLIRWGTSLGMIGGTIIGGMLAMTLPAFALTEAQLLEKLTVVPMFTVTDASGAPLVANITSPDGEDTFSVAGVFVSHADAEDFIERVQQGEETSGVQITPVSLAEVYSLQRRSDEAEAGLIFQYLPNADDVNFAVNLLQEAGEEITAEEFSGVPVFLARSSADGGYLTVSQGEETVVPAFFDAEALESLIERAEAQNDDLVNTITIQVVNLSGIIATLENSENTDLEQLEFIPSQDEIEYIRSLAPAATPGE